ncbi:hypothetical protein U1Q18_014588 [Sarracenia purpurea var. burkii]
MENVGANGMSLRKSGAAVRRKGGGGGGEQTLAEQRSGGVEQAERRDGCAVVRWGRLAGATRRLKTEEQRWCTVLGVQGHPRGPAVAQATTMVETRLAGAAASLLVGGEQAAWEARPDEPR